ncbi:MAG: tRNA lysidine(34) synthetase TilS [Akkermansiaceae bacterium]
MASLSQDQKYLLGISGGRDSVFLLHWLLKKQINKLVLCHLNHGLRGGESDGDAEFVAELAEHLQLPAVIDRIDVAALASAQKISLETAARNARHLFFTRCAREHKTNQVLLAHHADDQAETILFRLLRGAAGAKGMSASQTLRIGPDELILRRPLLNIRRSEITDILREHHLSFREDSSNTEPFATRNRIRHEILPLLHHVMSRDPVEPLLRAARRTSDLEAIASEALASQNILDPQSRIHLPSLRKLSAPLQRFALHDFLKQNQVRNLTEEHITAAASLLQTDGPPSINLPGDLRLRRKESRLFISS